MYLTTFTVELLFCFLRNKQLANEQYVIDKVYHNERFVVSLCEVLRINIQIKSKEHMNSQCTSEDQRIWRVI